MATSITPSPNNHRPFNRNYKQIPLRRQIQSSEREENCSAKNRQAASFRKQPQEFKQTASYLQKYQIGNQQDDRFVDYDEQAEKYLIDIGGNFSQSQMKSQIVSIHEVADDFPATLMSNINQNLKRNFKRLLQNKIKNDIEELRMIQNDFLGFIMGQNLVIKQQMQKMAMELPLKMSKIQQPANLQFILDFNEKRKAIATLEAVIQQKNQEISNLKRSVKDHKSTLQKQQQKSKQLQKLSGKKSAQESRSNLLESCSNCKILQIKHSTIMQELINTQKNIDDLLSENQKLQEYIFDMEQRIVGIDIEVERKVQDYLQTQKTKQAQQQHKQDYIEILRKLNDQNAALQQKKNRLERNCMKEQELRQLEKDLNQRQLDYQRKESELFASLARHQHQKDNLYQKQHQILVKQEEFSNKIQQLQHKQQELKLLQSMLQVQSQQMENKAKRYDCPPSIDRHQGLQGSFQRKGVNINIDSFGKIQQPDSSSLVKNYRDLNAKTQIKKFSHYNSVYIPELHFSSNQQERYQPNIYQESYSPKSNYNRNSGKQLYSQILRKQKSSISEFKPRSPPRNPQINNDKAATRKFQTSLFQKKEKSLSRQHQHKGFENKLVQLRMQLKRQMELIK